MSALSCYKCGRNPIEHNVSVYRVSQIGAAPVWACAEHRGEHPDYKADPDRDELVAVIEGRETS
jgi:hypothetical protein